MNCNKCGSPLLLDQFGLCPTCDHDILVLDGAVATFSEVVRLADANDARWRLCARCAGAGVVETNAIDADQQTATCVCQDGYLRRTNPGVALTTADLYAVGRNAPSSDLERRMVAVLAAKPLPLGEFVATLEKVAAKGWGDEKWAEAIHHTVERDVVRRTRP